MRKRRRDAFLLIAGMLCVLCFESFPSVTYAQDQVTATISKLKGTVVVFVQGGGAVAASIGTELRAGDTIQTQAGAEVVLTLSDGSTLELGEDTKLDLAVLRQEPGTKARTSKMKLLWGKLRSVLSPGHQGEGASFEVETPNVLAGVKFSQPVVTIIYDPLTDTTIIDAHTVDVIVTNLNTMTTQQFRSGTRVVVKQDSITSFRIPRVNTRIFQQTNTSVRDATSATVPTSVGTVGSGGDGGSVSGDGAETSSNPSPGSRPNRPERERRIFRIRLERE